ncbi:hypothetical protein EDD86DRAFT_197706 [Gorgonomyces haynaldii]|nr:hypothetical protein EDD86DRAFT_197706 [Gorgonomyces haynaldii]
MENSLDLNNPHVLRQSPSLLRLIQNQQLTGQKPLTKGVPQFKAPTVQQPRKPTTVAPEPDRMSFKPFLENQVSNESLMSVSQNPFKLADNGTSKAPMPSAGTYNALKRSDSLAIHSKKFRKERSISPTKKDVNVFDLVKNFDLPPETSKILYRSEPVSRSGKPLSKTAPVRIKMINVEDIAKAAEPNMLHTLSEAAEEALEVESTLDTQPQRNASLEFQENPLYESPNVQNAPSVSTPSVSPQVVEQSAVSPQAFGESDVSTPPVAPSIVSTPSVNVPSNINTLAQTSTVDELDLNGKRIDSGTELKQSPEPVVDTVVAPAAEIVQHPSSETPKTDAVKTPVSESPTKENTQTPSETASEKKELESVRDIVQRMQKLNTLDDSMDLSEKELPSKSLKKVGVVNFQSIDIPKIDLGGFGDEWLTDLLKAKDNSEVWSTSKSDLSTNDSWTSESKNVNWTLKTEPTSVEIKSQAAPKKEGFAKPQELEEENPAHRYNSVIQALDSQLRPPSPKPVHHEPNFHHESQDAYKTHYQSESIQSVALEPQTKEQFYFRESVDVVRPVIKKAKKKPNVSVSFKEAWKGELETRRIICVEENRFQESLEGDIGRMLVRPMRIEMALPYEKGDRVVDIELKHGEESFTSPPYTIRDAATDVAMEWEFPMNLVEEESLIFVLRVREMAEPTNLKRSFSTKLNLQKNLKSFSSRVLSKLTRTPSLDRMSQDSDEKPTLNHSYSFGSLSSMNLRQANSARVSQIRSATYEISNVREVADKCMKKIAQFEIEFVEQLQDNTAIVGRLFLEAIVFPVSNVAMELVPFSFAEYQDGLSAVKLHQRVWKEGILLQKGGDAKEWKRRHFRLQGQRLIGSNDKTMEQRTTIYLSLIEAMRYLEEDEGFVIEFRDGESISFKLEPSDVLDLEAERNMWMDVIEESHYILTSSPIPPWIS